MAEKTTIFTFLYHSSTSNGTFSKLVDITNYPALFSAPEKIDVSDLSHRQRLYEPGMIDVPDYEFGYIYTKAGYDAIKDLEGKSEFYQLRFGEDGEYGSWQWQGDIFTTPEGGEVNGARTAQLVCYPATEIEPVE